LVRYARHDLHGLLVIDKPLGLTSMDVVRRLRRAAGNCKTGHAGTLDPLATGVLVCCLGAATRAVDRLMGMTKIYEATVDLSAFTNTDDAEGERQVVDVKVPPSEADLRTALDALTGNVEQTPPAYSAIKINGQRAYKLARKGEEVAMPSRVVRVDSIELHGYVWPIARIGVTCGKGTYIRSLARQIGQRLGTGGYLTALRRTAIGPYTIETAVSLEDLPAPLLPEHLLPTPAVAE
jgi:tRNA pseudouridine55 synthase